MLKILLVSMPYTVLTMPSIAIAQLIAAAQKSCGEHIAEIESAHCFIDFAEFLGSYDNYMKLGMYSGIGLADWLFKDAAFGNDTQSPDSFKEFFFKDGITPVKKQIFAAAESIKAHISRFLDKIIADYQMEDYDVIGFSSMMAQNIASFALAKRLKECKPDIITIMGGPNCEHPMGKTIVENTESLDYVFSGDSLVSFPQFITYLAEGKRDAIAEIPGVHQRSTDDSTGMDYENIEKYSGTAYDLNELPPLDYDEYFNRIARSPLKHEFISKVGVPFQTSAGCWWADKVGCEFCGLAPHSYVYMQPETAVTHINQLIEKYAHITNTFEAVDSCMPVSYPEKVLPLINKDNAVSIQYEVRTKMSEQEMKALANANILFPQPGIESLSTKSLKLMKKGASAFDNIIFLRNCVELGLYPIWNNLFGMPDTDYTEYDDEMTINNVKKLVHLPPPTSNIPISFVRYSGYFRNKEDHGLTLTPHEYYRHIYPFTDSVLSDIAYLFEDKAVQARLIKKYMKNIRKMNMVIVKWIHRYRNTIPKLCFEGDLKVVDTRGKEDKVYTMGKAEKDLLLFLREPRTIDEMVAFTTHPVETVKGMLDSLNTDNLLFYEGKRYISLVSNNCTLDPELYAEYVRFVRERSNNYE